MVFDNLTKTHGDILSEKIDRHKKIQFVELNCDSPKFASYLIKSIYALFFKRFYKK